MGEIEIRGYAVRFDLEGREDWVCRLAGSLWACVKEERTLFTLGDAIEASKTPRSPAVAVILRVFADGREERLPSLEEALAEIERLRGVAPILLEGVPAIMHSSAPSSREEIGAAACEMLKAIERALSVLRGSEPVDPLAALEAAEQRLLEAEGWTQEPGEPTLWRSSTGHPWGPRRRLVSRDEAVSLARRAAKKGGS